MNVDSVKDPCGICASTVSWSDKGVVCDDCEVWFHASCVHMRSIVYNLEQSGVPWYCWNCSLPKFSSEIFANVPAESVHPLLLDISRASSLSTPSSSNLSDNNFIYNSTPPRVSTPAHSTEPPSFSSNTLSSTGDVSDYISHSAPVKHDQTLRTLVINFQSIRNKKAEFLNLLESSNPDIVVGTETWLKPSEFSSEFFPSSYTIFRKDRPNGFGGCLVATKSNLISHEIPHMTNAEAVYVNIKTEGREKPLIIGAVYRTPSVPYKDTPAQVVEISKSMEVLDKSATIWIGGDLNLPDIDWKSTEIVGNNTNKEANQIFIDTLVNYGLHQINDKPTREKNILEIFCTNRPGLISKCTVIPGLSYHDIVLTESRIKAKKNKQIAHTVSVWKKANFDAIREETKSFSEQFLASPPDTAEQQWEVICNHLRSMMSKHVPTKKKSIKFHQPWINDTIKRLARRKQRAWRKAKRTNKPTDWDRFKSLKKETRRENRKGYQGYIRCLIEDDADKNLWRLIKSRKTESVGIAPLKKNGLVFSQSKDKANILNNQFSSVFTQEDLDNLPDLGESPQPTMPDINITVNGIEKLLKNLNSRKAAGPDGIPCRLLQCVAKELAPALTKLFNTSLNTGQVPKEWCHAIVQPIFKKGDRSNAANYRPISLTCVCCKLMEHVIRSHITDHFESNGLYSDAQHGFRKRRSCETQLLLTVDDLAKEIDKGGQTDTILLDYAKAFDKVPHQRLVMKLFHYGIRGKALIWIQNFLANRTQQVVVEGERSEMADVTSGVPQGSVIGPTLFLVYINDIGDNISSKLRLFADDTILYRNIRNNTDALKLQDDLTKLQLWEQCWQMEFNVTKCHVLSVTNKKKPTPITYHLHGHQLEEVESAKYLGVELTKKLSWGKHVTNTAAKVNKTSAFICRNLKGCPTSVQTHCFKALARPVAEYASPVWDPHCQNHIDVLEASQRRAARRILKDFDRETSATSLLNRLELEPLHQRRKVDKAAMVYRIVNDLVDIQASAHFQQANRRLRGQQNKFIVPQSRTAIHLHSFFPSATRVWNSVTQTAVTAPSVASFKGCLRDLAKTT